MRRWDTVPALKRDGFVGFMSVAELRATKCRAVPQDQPGVYVVLGDHDGKPRFVHPSPAGWFHDEDPTVPVAFLKQHWVPNTRVVYVGKAGGTRPDGTPIQSKLHRRVRDLLSFGNGRKIGHRGGRYIWQLKGANDLIVCWMATPDDEPRRVEARMIQEFVAAHGKRPFGNCCD